MDGYWEEEGKKGLRVTVIVNSHCYCYFDCYHEQLGVLGSLRYRLEKRLRAVLGGFGGSV